MDRDIELVYFTGCPNVDTARANLRRALATVGGEAEWREWNLDDPETPDRVRGYASPAVLVAGRHISGATPMPEDSQACSVAGAPEPSDILRALGGGR